MEVQITNVQITDGPKIDDNNLNSKLLQREGYLPSISTTVKGKYEIAWDLKRDQASCVNNHNNGLIWKGSLLPSFQISKGAGAVTYAESKAAEAVETTPGIWKIGFEISGNGTGNLFCEFTEWGLRILNMTVNWMVETRIIGMHFGTKKITAEQLKIVPLENPPFWPDWRAEEYGVPCTDSSPTTSFWRKWDKGNAAVPLGSYGPAMGTPYSAAFPRPLYACALGGTRGWIAAGPGEIPDGALTLRLCSASSYLEYLYREDLWGAPDGLNRFWKEPFRLAWGDSAYAAYAALFNSLTNTEPKAAVHSRSFCGTWGAFCKGDFDLRKQADRYAGTQPADVMLIDDYWETFIGSGTPDHHRFPEFEQDLWYIEQKGMGIGLWQSIGWIFSPETAGLKDEDLLCGADGKPRLSQWLMDPHEGTGRLCYCLDPSSEKSRRYLEERTRRIIRLYNPVLLKLDFGYGLPGPDVCAPRDPAFRGEKLCRQLLEIITKAAKAVKPDITIVYYGISPLLYDCYDLLSLDDMGDCGSSPAYETAGHSQRCLWASLAAAGGMPVNTSSGYFWEAMEDILLDTAVTGINGSVLPQTDERGISISPSLSCRWRAIQTWHRKSTPWSPLWLDAAMGGQGSEPSVRSWGRTERVNGEAGIFALSLRGQTGEQTSFDELTGLEFTGKWAVISQDDNDIYTSGKLAVIPFSAGSITINRAFAAIKRIKLEGKTVETVSDLSYNSNQSLTLTALEEELDDTIGYIILL